ncbi:hypothetical protein QJS04_geneDACA014816 [Acorus gramineus]|uniref:Uncharacterized protein n=1 Tax=Acorus gramineus TaxID=55184 RepID=A0AAV9BQE0_ACOGR|nr:hypothetical protein QJS04_geneDACA014816 [Acorus gramineus]
MVQPEYASRWISEKHSIVFGGHMSSRCYRDSNLPLVGFNFAWNASPQLNTQFSLMEVLKDSSTLLVGFIKGTLFPLYYSL